jgi:formylglycine-generating enzyme required for sulfatase activity
LKLKTRYRAVSKAGVTPQGYISRLDASQACRNAGKRLCRAREWLRACQGSDGAFDWRGKCNLGKGHVMTAVFGTHVTMTYDSHYNSPRLNQEPGYLARTGDYAKCVNDYGLHDMVGNLHEWVADDVSARLRHEIPISYDDGLLGPAGNGVFMGGYFSAHGEHGEGCNYVTTAHRPDYHDYSTGFRCCADPK